MIASFDGGFRFLSNFHPSPFALRDALTANPGWPNVHASWGPMVTVPSRWREVVPVAPTVEHGYQACKAATWDEMIEVLRAPSPGAAKRMGREVKLREDWDRVRVVVMLSCLRAKFRPGSELARMLLDTGYQTLVEGNTWGDRYWGAVYGRQAAHDPTWRSAGWAHEPLVGRNMLGRCLMLVRGELDVYATTGSEWRA
jgi:ribA/ribD-fused uncharacterized protein